MAQAVTRLIEQVRNATCNRRGAQSSFTNRIHATMPPALGLEHLVFWKWEKDELLAPAILGVTERSPRSMYDVASCCRSSLGVALSESGAPVAGWVAKRCSNALAREIPDGSAVPELVRLNAAMWPQTARATAGPFARMDAKRLLAYVPTAAARAGCEAGFLWQC